LGDNTKIQWADATWQPTRGCQIVSPGCTNCYAMKMASRLEAMGQPHYRGLTQHTKAGAVWTGEVRSSSQGVLEQPLRWARPRRIFVDSMADLFAEGVADDWIDRAFAVMALAHWHTFLVLTKRPERMRRYFAGIPEAPFVPGARDALIEGEAQKIYHQRTGQDPSEWMGIHPPLPNVWLGTSAEDQRRADERIPHLLVTPAAKRFVSLEPLLGPIDAVDYLVAPPRLDWIITGGESGSGARPANPQWFRDIRDQCALAGVAYFHKQNGEWASVSEVPGPGEHFTFFPDGRTVRRVGKKRAGRLLDGVQHDAMPATA
jgi:protein gp37